MPIPLGYIRCYNVYPYANIWLMLDMCNILYPLSVKLHCHKHHFGGDNHRLAYCVFTSLDGWWETLTFLSCLLLAFMWDGMRYAPTIKHSYNPLSCFAIKYSISLFLPVSVPILSLKPGQSSVVLTLSIWLAHWYWFNAKVIHLKYIEKWLAFGHFKLVIYARQLKRKQLRMHTLTKVMSFHR